MGMYIRLQDLTEQSATGSQRIEEAIDVGNYRNLVIQTRIPSNSTTGTLVLEHAAVLEESAFAEISGFSVSLSADTNDVATVQDPLRYLRWKITTITGTAKFNIDIIAREA